MQRSAATHRTLLSSLSNRRTLWLALGFFFSMWILLLGMTHHGRAETRHYHSEPPAQVALPPQVGMTRHHDPQVSFSHRMARPNVRQRQQVQRYEAAAFDAAPERIVESVRSEQVNNPAVQEVMKSAVSVSVPLGDRFAVTRTADLGVEIPLGNWTKFYRDLTATVERFEGFILKEAVAYGVRRLRTLSTGSWTIVVPAKNFSSFVDQVGNLGEISRLQISTTSVARPVNTADADLKAARSNLERLELFRNSSMPLDEQLKLHSQIAAAEQKLSQAEQAVNSMKLVIDYSPVLLSAKESPPPNATEEGVEEVEEPRPAWKTAAFVLLLFLVASSAVSLLLFGLLGSSRFSHGGVQQVSNNSAGGCQPDNQQHCSASGAPIEAFAAQPHHQEL